MLAVIGPIRSLPTACMLAWLFKLSVNSKEFLLLEAEVSRFSLPENTTRWPEQVCGSGDTNRYTTCKELAAWFNQRRTVDTQRKCLRQLGSREVKKKNRFDPPQYRFCKSLEVCWSNISLTGFLALSWSNLWWKTMPTQKCQKWSSLNGHFRLTLKAS